MLHKHYSLVAIYRLWGGAYNVACDQVQAEWKFFCQVGRM